MSTLLVGSIMLSIFHALIPSHWLPVLAIGRQEGWTVPYILWVTFLAGSAHVLSTVLVGVALALAGLTMSEKLSGFASWLAPGLLFLMGVVYLYRHYYHHHFHLTRAVPKYGVVISLAVAMFLSPCLEVEGYFLAAGQYGLRFVAILALVYGVITILGMLLWVRFALAGLKKLNWHAWEHSAGLITGITLILSGLLLFIFD